MTMIRPAGSKPAKGKAKAAIDPPTPGQISAVVRASRALVGIAAESIAEVDNSVMITQLRVLVMLDARGPLNLAAVADGLDVNPSNASRICDRLLRAGLLDRQEEPTDRRNISLSVTEQGRQLVRRVTRHRRKAIRRALSRMSAREREAVVTALDKFAAAAGEPSLEASLNGVWPPN